MGDTYDKVKDNDKQTARQATIQLLSDYVTAIPKFSTKERQDLKFIYNIQKSADGEEELGEWEGKLAQLKKHFNSTTDGHNIMVTARISKVDDKLRKFQEKFTFQNEKVDKMQAILKEKITEVKKNQKKSSIKQSKKISTDMKEMESRIIAKITEQQKAKEQE